MSVAVLASALLLPLLLLLGSLGMIPVGADPGPEDRCQGAEAKFYAYQARSDGQFGPAVTTNNVDEAVAELYSRMDCDPLLAVVIAADASGQWGDANALYNYAQRLLRDRQAWDALVARTRAILDQCNNVGFGERSNEYNTLGMRRGTSPQVMPTLFQVSPDRPTFRTLEFDCGGGRVVVLKLDCGFQPVHPFFSLISTTPANPGSTPSISPPGTPPTTPPPTWTVPPTTPPPTTPTTTPPTTVPPGCPTGPDGCKPPIPPTPATCNLPDDLCHGGTGPPTPRPPATVQPTPTVAPPPAPPPPPVYTVPGPDPTTPVTSPSGVPD